MWAKGRRHGRASPKGLNLGLWGSATALFLVVTLSSAAFLLPQAQLPWLAAINLILVVHGMLQRGAIGGVIRFVLLQLGFTLGLYALMHGGEQLGQGTLAVARITLALLPGWWLSVTVRPERIGEVLCLVMPAKWAFVVAASIGLLPFMTQEIAEIYQLQRLRGARIAPKQLLNPRNWPELAYCVLFPLLIQLLKLAKQMALAAKSRHFGHTSKPTHWQDNRSEHGNK
ncbi:energy-coupling factor transporter transmembrane component T [Shewanella algae]|uniref:energy-coupling factor transporter transmembrane component T n=1 Tax=Shewanella algae TaxID=38313 RepID=UPI00131F8968|nr:energy-coupling factor transporter transmembrane component T [Shewanella algae]QHD53043.1 cobalt ABC transporter permease [Shewanella algae]